jgi:hypothetical protein
MAHQHHCRHPHQGATTAITPVTSDTKSNSSTSDTASNVNFRHSNLLLTLPSHLWRHVLTFYGYKDHTLAGRSCRYLHALWLEAVEKGKLPLFVPVDCKTLKTAVGRVHEDDRLTTIVVGKGDHQIDGDYLEVASTMNIVGDPGVTKDEIMVVGGIKFKRGIQGNCHLEHLTLRQAKEMGVLGYSSFTMDDVLVEQCGYGVLAYGRGVGRCTNVEVRQCGGSGVIAYNGASITLIGAKTTVHHNCTKGDSWEYGLKVYASSSSTIQLVSPLTKAQVSLDNGGGGNWGAYGGDITQIKTIAAEVATANEPHANNSTPRDVLQTLPTFMKQQILAFFGYKDYMLTARTCPYLKRLWTEAVERKRLPLFVPVDCNTLKDAMVRVHRDDRLTTIVVGQGEHQIVGSYLYISSAMKIVGDPGVPKGEIVVVGGIYFHSGIQGNCHLQHMTLRQAKMCGVDGYSSFTMEDVLVEQCGWSGVFAYGTGIVSRCTNVEVRQCGRTGVGASSGASITLIGAKTTVHHNCTKGESNAYGLAVFGSSSTIQLVFPLTKEIVSTDNSGGGNWGAAGVGADIIQINTIAAVIPPTLAP